MSKDADASNLRISNAPCIYKQRQDVLALKEQVISKVKNPNYWRTFVSFLHRRLTKDQFDSKMKTILTDRESRLLHNKLVRAIIFNSHFSAIPPPGVEIPIRKDQYIPTQIPPPMRAPSSTNFQSSTSAQLHHLPTKKQLQDRIKFLMSISSRKVTIDSDALEVLHLRLVFYIYSILDRCHSFVKPHFSFHETAKIEIWQIIHIYHSSSSISKMISPEIITKYTNLCK